MSTFSFLHILLQTSCRREHRSPARVYNTRLNAMRSNLNTTSIKSEHFYKAYNLIAMGEHGSPLQNDNYFVSFIYYLTKS